MAFESMVAGAGGRVAGYPKKLSRFINLSKQERLKKVEWLLQGDIGCVNRQHFTIIL